MHKRSLGEVGSSEGLGLFYAPIEAIEENRRGPFYLWSPEPRKLRYRYWMQPHDTDRVSIGYGYYRSGRLYRYMERRFPKRNTEPRFEWFEERYYPDGRLLAVGYSRLDLDGRKVVAFYRDGQPISYDDFEMEQRPSE